MTSKNLGSFIKTNRVNVGLSMRGLAKLAHISPGFLSEVENGLKTPSPKILGKIFTAIGKTTV